MIRLCKEYNTIFYGFRVPIGAIYGKNGNKLFVCIDYSGIENGMLSIFQNNHGSWIKNNVNNKSHQFKAIDELLSKMGFIPKVKSWENPDKKFGKVYGSPNLRKVSYNYTANNQGIGSLVRQRHDNADHSGGGSVIMNENSYYAIYKDMMRTGTDWQKGGYFDKK